MWFTCSLRRGRHSPCANNNNDNSKHKTSVNIELPWLRYPEYNRCTLFKVLSPVPVESESKYSPHFFVLFVW